MKRTLLLILPISLIAANLFAQNTTTELKVDEPINPMSLIRNNNGVIGNYDKVIAANPQNSTAYLERGVAKMRLRRYGDAIADFTVAITLKPDMAKAYNERGIAKKT